MRQSDENEQAAVWQQLLPASHSDTTLVTNTSPHHVNFQDNGPPHESHSTLSNGAYMNGKPRSSSFSRSVVKFLPFRKKSNELINGDVEANTNLANRVMEKIEKEKAKKSESEQPPTSPLLKYRVPRGSRRMRKRVVFKNGDCNVLQTNVAKLRRRYLQDLFTTMVDIQWRWTLLIFTMSFILSWMGFAVIWWLIAFTHGDLEPDHLPANQEASKWVPCVININSFASCFLFSIETQHTIGYGSRHTTEECPEAIFVMCIQSIIGVMIQAFMVGVVFSKMSRPKLRAQTLLFSRNAVICERDGQLCLMFRVGDMRKSHIIGACVRAQMIRTKISAEGEQMPYYQQELKVGVDHDERNIFFIWPMTIVHKITPDSPLYNMSASDLIKEKFEIVVILEGTIESTSMTTQARSSYLPNELLWGHRFEPLVSFKKDTGQYAVDYSLFNNTYEVDTPLCSSRDLDEFRRLKEGNLNNTIALQGARPSADLLQQLRYQSQHQNVLPPKTNNRSMIFDPTDISPSMRGVSSIAMAPAISLSLSQPNMQGSSNASLAVSSSTKQIHRT